MVSYSYINENNDDLSRLFIRIRHVDCTEYYATQMRSFITGCAVAQHCYNSDVRFLWENLEL